MEKLRVDIQLSPEQIVNRQQLIRDLQNNAHVQSFLCANHLDASYVKNYVGKFSDYVEMKNTCTKCKGLDMCSYANKGEYRDLVVVNNKLLVETKRCWYLEEWEKRYAHIHQYIINHLRENLYEVSFTQLDLEKEDYEYLVVYDQLQDWFKNPKKGLYFYGAFGVGKTYLTACISNDFARMGKQIAFINSSEFCNSMRMNWNQSEYLQEMIRLLKQVDLLVIDDVGSEIVTNWVRDELLFPILDDRMGNHKLTLFTSNYNYDELLNHFMYNNKGEKDEINALRLMERIRSLSDLIQLKGKNRRV